MGGALVSAYSRGKRRWWRLRPSHCQWLRRPAAANACASARLTRCPPPLTPGRSLTRRIARRLRVLVHSPDAVPTAACTRSSARRTHSQPPPPARPLARRIARRLRVLVHSPDAVPTAAYARSSARRMHNPPPPTPPLVPLAGRIGRRRRRPLLSILAASRHQRTPPAPARYPIKPLSFPSIRR
ncbi:hypothetical protein QFZ39_003181 [Paraburkholderia graminis]|uniref:Uncharacterized protein n=1 Tax=Paraburkholderia graminis TaxID=60548 RepID=A0ABD5CCY8_9BURK|nr:hypothetical protein [Paraburkholderia graminis]MDR6203072.1 hypothetical protein [Paraburkholderia graminis]